MEQMLQEELRSFLIHKKSGTYDRGVITMTIKKLALTSVIAAAMFGAQSASADWWDGPWNDDGYGNGSGYGYGQGYGRGDARGRGHGKGRGRGKFNMNFGMNADTDMDTDWEGRGRGYNDYYTHPSWYYNYHNRYYNGYGYPPPPPPAYYGYPTPQQGGPAPGYHPYGMPPPPRPMPPRSGARPDNNNNKPQSNAKQ